ncbi:peptidylprolyl isomerase [Paludibacterium paludis]|uniref:Chaperone SurA n=1 Tax=Paludibacterium paludis TaxID=1225769 RepID=A0A918P0G7_9NEIS|nr:peptidylprolyl isomerase [Paludibacterium paludis]GGY10015.1 chaperone SurA [Paludibacterium paludis]
MKKTFLTLLLAASFSHAQSAPVVGVDRIVAIVNKSVITEQDLKARIAQARRSLEAQKIAPPDGQVLSRQVLDQMITEEVQLQFAASNNITADDSDIDQAIKSLAQQNRTDLAGLKARVARDGEPWETFRNDIRREILLSRVRESEVDNRTNVSDTEVEQVLKSAQSTNNAEYHLASILVSVPERADGKTTEDKARKAEKALAELNAGQPFGKVAATYSDAPNALKGGELGWRPSNGLPPDFVTLLESMKPGQHTGVIRTQQGFFIFQMQEKRTGKGPVMVEQYHARHILVRTNEITSDAEARAKIQQIRDRIVKGAAFADMAKQFSEDGSNAKGGDLGWLNPGDTVPEFEKAMVALPLNTVSEPVRSPFGWHLILLESKRTQDVSGEREKAQAKQQIRARKAEQTYIDWVRQLRDSAYIEDHLDDK